MTARWYTVNRIGDATLCVDKRDAEENAHEADLVWPGDAPHRAVQLFEAGEVERLVAEAVAAERERFGQTLERVTDALAQRLGTNADEWREVEAARELLGSQRLN